MNTGPTPHKNGAAVALGDRAMSATKRTAWLDCVKSPDGPRPAYARLVALIVADHAGKDGTNAFMSERTLAAETGLNRRTVRKGLKSLVDEAWLNPVTLGVGQYGKDRVAYHLNLPANGAHVAPMEKKQQAGQWGTTGAPNGASIGAPIGALIGAHAAPELLTLNSQLLTQEGTLPRSGNPDLEKEPRGLARKENPDGYIADLELTDEAIGIIQRMRPGADPAALFQKWREWGARKRGTARGWKKSLATCAKDQILDDDERRAEQAGIANGIGPRNPGESVHDYQQRTQSPPVNPELRERIANVMEKHP